MVEGIGNTPPPGTGSQVYSEYEDVEQALMAAFPDKTELEIQQAVGSYLETVAGQDASAMDGQVMLDHITRLFNVEISTQAANAIKTEWEDLTESLDIGVSDLASILTDYSSDGIDETDRDYLVLVWQMLQGELEEAIGDESTVVATANKNLQEKEFTEFVEKKAKEMEKAGKSKFWGKVLKWAGVVAAVAAAAVACVLIATGVGAPAGAALLAGAAILLVLALASTASAVLEEFGVEWTLGQGLGTGIAKLINACGGDVDEKKFAMWTAVAVQMTLVIVATVLTCGAGAAAAPGAAGSAGATAANAAATTAKAASSMAKLVSGLKFLTAALGLSMAGVKAGTVVSNYGLAKMQAELLELKALLEQLAETRNMDQELTAAILSKIFEAMRGNVADAMDSILQDLELVVSMNLNKA